MTTDQATMMKLQTDICDKIDRLTQNEVRANCIKNTTYTGFWLTYFLNKHVDLVFSEQYK